MTDIPPAALTDAGEAVTALIIATSGTCNPAFARRMARAALDAAAPHLVAAERERACYIAGAYLDGNVLREFAGEIRCELIRQEAP